MSEMLKRMLEHLSAFLLEGLKRLQQLRELVSARLASTCPSYRKRKPRLGDYAIDDSASNDHQTAKFPEPLGDRGRNLGSPHLFCEPMAITNGGR